MKISDSLHGALCTLREYGPAKGVEVRMPPAMDGTRRIKLECHLMSAPQLSKLEAAGYVTVERSEAFAPVNAVGKRGNLRRHVVIAITDAGRAAIA